MPSNKLRAILTVSLIFGHLSNGGIAGRNILEGITGRNVYRRNTFGHPNVPNSAAAPDINRQPVHYGSRIGQGVVLPGDCDRRRFECPRHETCEITACCRCSTPPAAVGRKSGQMCNRKLHYNSNCAIREGGYFDYSVMNTGSFPRPPAGQRKACPPSYRRSPEPCYHSSVSC